MLKFLVCTLFISLCFGSSDIDCPHQGFCTCPTSTTINCIGIGVDPLSLNLPDHFLDFTFANNRIGAMKKETYQTRKAMRWLSLQHNHLTEIEAGIFDDNPDLRTIDLSNNLIKNLPATLFQNNKLLTNFYCSNNNLTEISSDLFKGLSNLQDIRLNNNQLVSVPPSTFSPSRMINMLYLQNNLLETAHWKWISHFNHSSEYDLILYGNPWSCDCRMKNFATHKAKWTRTYYENPNDIHHRSDLPYCHFPDGSKTLIKEVDLSKFVCEKPKDASRNKCENGNQKNECTITFKEGVSGIIHCGGVGKPFPKVEIHKKSGHQNTKPRNGSTALEWNYVTSRDAGEYLCIGNGFDESGEPASFQTTIIVVVETSGSPALGIVLGLLFLAIVVMSVAFFYRTRYRKRAGYGSLSKEEGDTVVHFDVGNGGSHPLPTEVTYMDDENAVIEEKARNPASDDEKEVLV